MSEPTELGARVRSRIKALRLTVAEVERTGGWNPGYILDLTNGRKKAIDYENLAKLARILKTTDAWLLRGDAVEQRAHSPAGGRAVHVGGRFEAVALIKRMDLDTGECGIALDGAEVVAGVIIDPALQLPGNAYARAMFEMSPIRILAKRVTLENGTTSVTILDGEKVDETTA